MRLARIADHIAINGIYKTLKANPKYFLNSCCMCLYRKCRSRTATQHPKCCVLPLHYILGKQNSISNLYEQIRISYFLFCPALSMCTSQIASLRLSVGFWGELSYNSFPLDKTTCEQNSHDLSFLYVIVNYFRFVSVVSFDCPTTVRNNKRLAETKKL